MQELNGSSAGPALTSDGGHSSRSESLCGLEASSDCVTPAALKSLQLVGEQLATASKPLAPSSGNEEPCLCGSSSHVPPTSKQAGGTDRTCQLDSGKASKASKLRQLFHFETRRLSRTRKQSNNSEAKAAGQGHAHSPKPDSDARTKSGWLKGKVALTEQRIESHESQETRRDPKAAKEQASQTVEDHLEDRDQSGEAELIRPKSALSSTCADLIAAQKSLAAAAAAKVKRDRMYKLGASDSQMHNHSSDGDMTTTTTSSKESILTVKVVPHGNHGPSYCANALSVNTSAHRPVAGTGAQGAISRHLIGSHHHNQAALMSKLSNQRLGDNNSVGMTSESSPSNNGAESDNSIATNQSGNSTENASVESRSQTNSEQQTPSPLGILSRILLNNKNFVTRMVEPQPNPTGATRDYRPNGSSSMTPESPSIDSPPVRPKVPSGELSQRLDQLMLNSRSRQPIIGAPIEKQPIPTAQARQPVRSALKSSNGVANLSNQLAGISTEGAAVMVEPPINGLPRVSSMSRLPTGRHLSDFQPINLSIHQPAPICDFHSQSNALFYPSPQYGISSQIYQASVYPPGQRHSHDFNAISRFSQQDLRPIMSEASLNVGPGPVSFDPQVSQRGQSSYQNGHFEPVRLLNELDRFGYQQQIYSHDDSIYIPHPIPTPVSGALSQRKLYPSNGSQHPRPKSSLDSMILREDGDMLRHFHGPTRIPGMDQHTVYGTRQSYPSSNGVIQSNRLTVLPNDGPSSRNFQPMRPKSSMAEPLLVPLAPTIITNKAYQLGEADDLKAPFSSDSSTGEPKSEGKAIHRQPFKSLIRVNQAHSNVSQSSGSVGGSRTKVLIGVKQPNQAKMNQIEEENSSENSTTSETDQQKSVETNGNSSGSTFIRPCDFFDASTIL